MESAIRGRLKKTLTYGKTANAIINSYQKGNIGYRLRLGEYYTPLANKLYIQRKDMDYLLFIPYLPY